MQDGDVMGTKNPTGHSILINCHFEQPFGEIKRKARGGDLLLPAKMVKALCFRPSIHHPRQRPLAPSAAPRLYPPRLDTLEL